MLNKLFILVILSILSIIIIKVYYYFKKVEEFNNLVNGKYGKICRKSNTIREVYGCGRNNKGQLGFDSKKYGIVPQTIPISIPNISNITITQIACGNEHSLFLTSNNRVYSCGWNNKGQLGLNLDSTKIRRPQLIENYYYDDSNSINYDEITINKIACGGKHSIFLSSNNRVYSCGSNASGQLGLNLDSTKIRRPQLIKKFFVSEFHSFWVSEITITQIACGGYYSLFLTNEGHVYSCGSNYFGQLGLNLDSTKIRRPRLIENYYNDYNSINYDAIKIKQIAGGNVHSLFLTSNNYVYSCGSNYYGQLGLNSTKDEKKPQLIENYYVNNKYYYYNAITITQIAGGLYYSLFLTNEGHVYSCGSNYFGQLGLNSTKDEKKPQLIKKYYDSNSNSINYNEIKIKQIACGHEHSLFLTSNNRVYSCGWNDKGQLGLNSTKDEKTPQLIETFNDAIMITQIAGGGEHTFINIIRQTFIVS